MATLPLVLLVLLALFQFPSPILSHSRFACPPARTQDDALKTGPCGGIAKVSPPGTTDMPAGAAATLRIEETISHRGAPWRIDLLDEGDNYICTLLDHMPHNDASTASRSNPQDYYITVDMPDIDCKNCALSMVSPMTDKINAPATTCTEPVLVPGGDCRVTYYSCSDINIAGSRSIADVRATGCSPTSATWPYTTRSLNGQSLATGTYANDEGSSTFWGASGNSETGWAISTDVPGFFRSRAGPCMGIPVDNQALPSGAETTADPNSANGGAGGSGVPDGSAGAAAAIACGIIFGIMAAALLVLWDRRRDAANAGGSSRSRSKSKSKPEISGPLGAGVTEEETDAEVASPVETDYDA